MPNANPCGVFPLLNSENEKILANLFGILFIVLLIALIIAILCMNLHDSILASSKICTSRIVIIILVCAYTFKSSFHFLSPHTSDMCNFLLFFHIAYYACLYAAILLLLYKFYVSLGIKFIKRRRGCLIWVQRITFVIVISILASTLIVFLVVHGDPQSRSKIRALNILMLAGFAGITTLILVQGIFLRIRTPARFEKRKAIYITLVIYSTINLITWFLYELYYDILDHTAEGEAAQTVLFLISFVQGAFPTFVMIIYIGKINEKEYDFEKELKRDSISQKKQQRNQISFNASQNLNVSVNSKK